MTSGIKSIARLLALALLSMVLQACAKPIDAEHMAYVGHWKGATTSLSISAAGQVKYARKNGASHTSINAPLQAFVGPDFIVGVGPLTTTFVVSEAPHQAGSEWRMTVDGEELTRGSGETVLVPDQAKDGN